MYCCNQDCQGFKRPYILVAIERPYTDFGRPYMAIERPHTDFGRPYMAIECPYRAIRRPYKVLRRFVDNKYQYRYNHHNRYSGYTNFPLPP